VFELFEPEEEILIDLAVRYTHAAQALLQGGVYQATGAGRALACPGDYVLDYSAALLTLHPALLYQPVHHLLDPLAGNGGGAYLQKDQTFQRIQHMYLPAEESVDLMITRNAATRRPFRPALHYVSPLRNPRREMQEDLRSRRRESSVLYLVEAPRGAPLPEVLPARQALYRHRAGAAIKMEL
jgi:hypothetical protein